MDWLLTIWLVDPGGLATEVKVGHIITEDVCIATGDAIGAKVAVESPDITLYYVCDYIGQSA